MASHDSHTNRRTVLKKAAGIAAITSIAGCTGSGDGGSGSDGGSGGGGGGQTSQKTAADHLDTFENDAGFQVGANWEAVQELAKDEGQLVISSSTDTEDFNVWMEEFPHDWGDNIEYITGDGTKLAVRDVEAYRAGNPRTSCTVGNSGVVLWQEEGVAMELKEEYCPEWADASDDVKTKYMLGQRLKSGAIFANEEVVDDPQAILEDGWMSFVQDDQWTGKLGWDPTPNWGLMGSLLKAQGEEFFDHLVDREPEWVDSHTDLVRFVAAGKFPISFSYADKVLDIRPDETPIEVVQSAPMPATASGGGVASFAPAPNRALVLINWLSTETGQKQMAKTHQSVEFGMEGWPPSQDWEIGGIVTDPSETEAAKEAWLDRELGAGAAGA